MRVYFDTESIGFYGPTIMIQYCIDRGEPVIHNCWEETVDRTLSLIEFLIDADELIGFNLSHDAYHLSRTYDVLSMLPRLGKPNPLDYRDCEVQTEAHERFCLKPKSCLDLMVHGRKGVFQNTLNQKDIVIRKVPKVLAVQLVAELTNAVKVPDIYFSKSKIGYHWLISNLDIDGNEVGKITKENIDSIDPNFVNVKLKFAPSASLKMIMAKVLGHDVTTLDDLPELGKVDESAYNINKGDWVRVFNEHTFMWKNDKRRIKYALNDPIYTRELDDYFGNPPCGDDDSELAFAIGNFHWRGFSVDLQKAAELERVAEQTFKSVEINVNAPKQVKEWLLEVCNPFERIAVPDTQGDTLNNLVTPEWKEQNPILYDRVEKVLAARRAAKEIDLLGKLKEAKKLYVTFKVIGTKSNRMAGGSESYISSHGSINPQGIKKGNAIRDVFTFVWPGYSLCGGDFSGHEVVIAEADWGDENLRTYLLTGNKFHGLFGSVVYGKNYEEIVSTSDKGMNEPDGFYQRSKRAVFGWFYGAFKEKLAKVLWLEVEEVEKGLEILEERFPGIRKAREIIYNDFAALRQPNGIGSKIEWVEPKDYVESFLGFRRYFSMEYSVIRALFEMANNPSSIMKALGKEIKVMRRDRFQTGAGAVSSALYGAAFNLQSAIMRTAANHRIQSPGGQINKHVQAQIYKLQPTGIGDLIVAPLNFHDELMCPTMKGYEEKVKEIVDRTVESFRPQVPLIEMEWKSCLKSWKDK